MQFNKIKEKDKKYILGTYAPYDIAFIKGEGNTLIDVNGKHYIDFLGGIAVNSLGYNNKIVNKAVRKNSKLLACSNYFYSPQRGQLAEKLIKGTHFNKAFFANSGAEANECAIKLARKYYKEQGLNKYKIVSFTNSFHGRTLATVTATGQPKYNLPFAPLPEGIGIYLEYNNIDSLAMLSKDDTVAAVILELIQGEGGVIPANIDFVNAIKTLAKKKNFLIIIDEVQTGGMRTGKFFAFEDYKIKPDIVTLAKGIGGGVPIGACLTTDKIASSIKVGDHGTTFGSNPFCCGVALDVVSALKKKAFSTHVTEIGQYLTEQLKKISTANVVTVRGKGLMIGMTLNDSKSAKDIVASMLEQGFILNACGNNTLRFLPPLTITNVEIDKMIAKLQPLL